MTKRITEENFDCEVLGATEPVLVDFYADWCGPCRAQGPIVERVANQYEGRASVGKVDVDTNQALAGRYGIRSIPTLILFKNGQVVEQLVGVHGPAQLHPPLKTARHVHRHGPGRDAQRGMPERAFGHAHGPGWDAVG